jgi:hypothetical protein
MTPRPVGLPNENPALLRKEYPLREALRGQIEILQATQPIPSESESRPVRGVSRLTVRKVLDSARVGIAVAAVK